MPTDIVFNPAAADAARRAKALPAPSQHCNVIEESPRGQSALDPFYDLHRPENLPKPAAALNAGRKLLQKQREREYAAANRPEYAAVLAHKWGVPLELVNRLYELQSENFLLNADISSLQQRLAALESKK